MCPRRLVQWDYGSGLRRCRAGLSGKGLAEACEPAKEKVIIEDEQQVCPYCAETIKTEAVKCKHCGEWLSEAAVRAKLLPAVSAPPSPEKSSDRQQPVQDGCQNGCSCSLMLVLCLVLPLLALASEGWLAFGIILYFGVIAFGLLSVFLNWLCGW